MKRYRIDFGYGRYYFDEREDGDWVKQTQAQAAIDEWKNLAHKREYTISKLRSDLTACQIERDRIRQGIKATRDGCCGSEDNILCYSCRDLEKLLKQEPTPQSDKP